jgi:hypothetical protein
MAILKSGVTISPLPIHADVPSRRIVEFDDCESRVVMTRSSFFLTRPADASRRWLVRSYGSPASCHGVEQLRPRIAHASCGVIEFVENVRGLSRCQLDVAHSDVISKTGTRSVLTRPIRGGHHPSVEVAWAPLLSSARTDQNRASEAAAQTGEKLLACPPTARARAGSRRTARQVGTLVRTLRMTRGKEHRDLL